MCRIRGNPDRAMVSMSGVERRNRTVRMPGRRFSNALSRKLGTHMRVVASCAGRDKCCRTHCTCRVILVAETGLNDTLWDMGELIHINDNCSPKPGNSNPRDRRNSG